MFTNELNDQLNNGTKCKHRMHRMVNIPFNLCKWSKALNKQKGKRKLQNNRDLASCVIVFNYVKACITWHANEQSVKMFILGNSILSVKLQYNLIYWHLEIDDCKKKYDTKLRNRHIVNQFVKLTVFSFFYCRSSVKALFPQICVRSIFLFHEFRKRGTSL